MIESVQASTSKEAVELVVYSGDVDATPEQIIQKAKALRRDKSLLFIIFPISLIRNVIWSVLTSVR